MLNSGVLSFRVLADENGVDVVVSGFVALNRNARPDVGKEVEGTAEGKVKGDVTLAD